MKKLKRGGGVCRKCSFMLILSQPATLEILNLTWIALLTLHKKQAAFIHIWFFYFILARDKIWSTVTVYLPTWQYRNNQFCPLQWRLLWFTSILFTGTQSWTRKPNGNQTDNFSYLSDISQIKLLIKKIISRLKYNENRNLNNLYLDRSQSQMIQLSILNVCTFKYFCISCVTYTH